jgi:DNA-binding SARP family transcriptional activator
MEFGVLGPLLVRDESGALPPRAAKQRTLLATLLLRAGRVVPVDQLVEMLWDGEPPATALPSLRNYVLRLRAGLGEAGRRIGFRDRGYVLEIAEDEVDLLRFARLRDDGVAAFDSGRFAVAAQLLGRALQEWRGPALVDVESDALHREECPHLAESRLDTVELRLEAECRAGKRVPWSAELRDLARAHPERERLWGHVIASLHADGRSTEALAEYRRMELVLDKEYGVRPGGRLRALQKRILGGEAPSPDPATVASPPPFQIPAAPAHLIGRDCESASLVANLTSASTTVISGQPGIGKTALALQAAHAVRESFPGGVLYADLRAATGNPARPLDVLGSFLQALGLPPHALPPTLDDRAALLRTTLTQRKTLIVLDDAADAAQVSPLLPGSSPGAVLITSRCRLDELTGAAHAEPGALTPQASAALIDALAGRARAAAEPRPFADLVRTCEGLPLALTIVATRLAARPSRSVRWLAERLSVADSLLEELTVASLSVRAGLTEVCQRLDPAQARAFHTLAASELTPGAPFSVPEAARLLALPPRAAERLLEHLVDHYLLACTRTGYAFRPLTRVFGRGMAGDSQRSDLISGFSQG